MNSGTTTKTKTVPLISSGTAGPLGAVHLPRLWTKLTISNAGGLPEGYDICGQGFDQMTLNALGLDRDETIAYVRDNRPTYLQFEQWVIQKNGGNISQDRIDKHNAAIRGYNHSDELAGQMREASGLKDPSKKDAVTLNSLEDLDELHKQARASA
jgi:hypothetical protein